MLRVRNPVMLAVPRYHCLARIRTPFIARAKICIPIVVGPGSESGETDNLTVYTRGVDPDQFNLYLRIKIPVIVWAPIRIHISLNSRA